MPLTRLTIKNFKSIKYCDITLSDLNVLIGENGTGKTNLLDAISYFYYNLTGSNISTEIFNENNHYSNEVRISLTYDLSEGVTKEEYREFEIPKKGGLSSKTNLIPYDGTPEIKNRDGQKYLYVRKRVGNWLTSSHVDAYSDEMSCISYCSAIPERHGNCANIFAV